jgi:hypothetical protein
MLAVALQDEVIIEVPWSWWSGSASGNPMVVTVGGDGFILALHCMKSIAVEKLTPGLLFLAVDGLFIDRDH